MLFIKNNKTMFSLGLLALAAGSIFIQQGREVAPELARPGEAVSANMQLLEKEKEKERERDNYTVGSSVEVSKKHESIKMEGYIAHADEQPEKNDLFNMVSNDSFEAIDDAPEHSKAISMNIDALKKVTLGDSFNLPISNNNLTLTVSDIQHHKSGGMRIKLHVENAGPVYRAVFSIGEYVTKGKIITPTASYSLKVVNDNGWVIDRNLIKRASDNPNTPLSQDSML
ncbi:MAG: hypothetical protein COA42_19945 [Alteromonadaceae bacterium]|nr:MAG: hypothetical protein COA42_19945 [Alteromonadaceae bacterium]